MQTLTRLPLYWKVCLINGALFVAGTLVLALTPATVSAQVVVSEAITLALGLSAILIANALLLRSVLRPLDRLTAIMPDVDLLRPGQRLPVPAQGAVRNLIEGFNGMLARLEAERSTSIGQALHAQDAERQRIGRELHDEIGQSLTVVLLELKSAIDLAPPELGCRAASPPTAATNPRRINEKVHGYFPLRFVVRAGL
jgi:two-component system, NarL family, sensor histidine kinase UhpB